MEFAIKVLVVVMVALIAFFILATLIGIWGGTGNSLIQGIIDWFRDLSPSDVEREKPIWETGSEIGDETAKKSMLFSLDILS